MELNDIDPRNEGLRNLHELVTNIERPEDKRIPIVLVSGFTGWGEPLFGAFNYWGGFEDLPAVLAKAGYAVIVVKIGPLSSNWERACEIHAQLTTPWPNNPTEAGFDNPSSSTPSRIPVKYGTYHPPYNPDRPENEGETKRAVLFGELKNWTWSRKSPVHFICHSQGGNTVRMLIEIMSGNHADVFPGDFQPKDRRNWIKSVVTLGTPHKGTTVTDVFNNLLPEEPYELLTRLVASCSFNQPRFYDLQLDHWGFGRRPNESARDMYRRLLIPVKKWWDGEANGFYDNSIVGVGKLNEFDTGPSNDIFYFTLSFYATQNLPDQLPTPKDFHQVPLHPFLDAFRGLDFWNLGGKVGAFGAFLAQQVPGAPNMLQYAKFAVDVANRHLRSLGYFDKIPTPGEKIPRPDMLPAIALFGYGMGGYEIPKGKVPGWLKTAARISEQRPSSLLQPNDGIVNTISMSGPPDVDIYDPKQFPRQELADMKTARRAKATGRYWHLGTNATMDHADEIGVFTEGETYEQVEHMYILLARLFTVGDREV